MPSIPDLAILFQRFGIALGIGLMIGVEREREKDTFGGIRTFPLIALLGCISAMIHDHFAAWSFAATFIILSAFVLVSYLLTGSAGAPGITTEVASLLVFLYGGLVWWRMTELAAALAVVTVLLLATKRPLEQLSLRIQSEDIIAALQFGVITLIVLPILPDRTFGPLDVLNPQQIWKMVVLIAGINLVGYVLIKILGARQGIGLAGLLGGLASSTATAL
ncbi:MAG: MgtC/SapB family protein, partial [Anaerolineales bacterium]|nr:MgtC/SapB family protein [Anaerolineales bacterium]